MELVSYSALMGEQSAFLTLKIDTEQPVGPDVAAERHLTEWGNQGSALWSWPSPGEKPIHRYPIPSAILLKARSQPAATILVPRIGRVLDPQRRSGVGGRREARRYPRSFQPLTDFFVCRHRPARFA